MSLARLWLLAAASSYLLTKDCCCQDNATNAPSIGRFIFVIDIPYVDVITSSMTRAAIVGAGIGGTAAALHLRAAFGNATELTVFESGRVGGRLATVEMSGHAYEAGGSIIHPLNLEMKALVKELGEQRSLQ